MFFSITTFEVLSISNILSFKSLNNGENMHKAIITMIVITICFPISGAAEQTAHQQFEFANTLMKQERYKTSITEFQRFLFLFPNDRRTMKATYKIGLSYQLQKQYILAIDTYHKLVQSPQPMNDRIQAAFRLSECYQAQNNYQEAQNVLITLQQHVSQPQALDKIHYRLGWLFIKNNQYHMAREQFQSIQNVSEYPMAIINKALETKDLPYKNPYLAGGLSIVPGLGQAYCERYQDAALSFIVNGIIAWAAWENFDHDRPAMGTLISFFGMGFYSGNIYGATNSAHKHNQRLEKQWLYHLQHNLDSTNDLYWGNE